MRSRERSAARRGRRSGRSINSRSSGRQRPSCATAARARRRRRTAVESGEREKFAVSATSVEACCTPGPLRIVHFRRARAEDGRSERPTRSQCGVRYVKRSHDTRGPTSPPSRHTINAAVQQELRSRDHAVKSTANPNARVEPNRGYGRRVLCLRVGSNVVCKMARADRPLRTDGVHVRCGGSRGAR